MDLLLKTIRTRLINDAMLTAIVSAEDIGVTYSAENANYPCIVIGIKSGGSSIEIPGINKANLIVYVYSTTNKQQLWTIYDRIKLLLHNCEHSITDVSRIIHFIYEVDVDDDQYDTTNNAWVLKATYTLAFGVSGLSLTTGANGAIYADALSVSASPSKEVAKFRGEVSLEVSFESEVRRQQDRFGKAVYYHTGIAKLTIGEVIFKAEVLNLLWSITTNNSGTLNDGSTSAVIYQLSQSSHPLYLQVLFQMIKTDDGRKLEIESSKSVCQNLRIPFSKKDFSVFNCEWLLLGDDNDNIVKVAIEN